MCGDVFTCYESLAIMCSTVVIFSSKLVIVYSNKLNSILPSTTSTLPSLRITTPQELFPFYKKINSLAMNFKSYNFLLYAINSLTACRDFFILNSSVGKLICKDKYCFNCLRVLRVSKYT
jgi:hypothetical protein